MEPPVTAVYDANILRPETARDVNPWLTALSLSEGDGTRTRNHRIDRTNIVFSTSLTLTQTSGYFFSACNDL
jgi:hypothetical protein